MEDLNNPETSQPQQVEAKPKSYEPKLIPESDLIALKKRFEKESAELTNKLSDSNLEKDKFYQDSLNKQAEMSKLSAELSELKSSLVSLTSEKQRREELESALTQAKTKLLDSKRSEISLKYGIPSDKLVSKSEQELTSIAEALELVGHRRAHSFDTGTSLGTDTSKLSTFEKLSKGLEEIKRR